MTNPNCISLISSHLNYIHKEFAASFLEHQHERSDLFHLVNLKYEDNGSFFKWCFIDMNAKQKMHSPPPI